MNFEKKFKEFLYLYPKMDDDELYKYVINNFLEKENDLFYQKLRDLNRKDILDRLYKIFIEDIF